MSVYRRGGVYWYKFRFEGQAIRESARSSSKTIAREAERVRRRELERGVNRLEQPKRMPLFKLATEQWLATRSGLAPHTLEAYRTYVRTLTEQFGERLISDFSEGDIAALIRQRQGEGFKPRRI